MESLRWLRSITREEFKNSYGIYSKGISIMEDDEPSPVEYRGEIVFIDGVLRNFYTAWYGFRPVVISQIVVGAVSVKLGEFPSILEEPLSELVIAVFSESDERIPDAIKLDDMTFKIIVSRSDPFETVRTRMETLEMELARNLVESMSAIVVKDGTLRPIYGGPVFMEGRGPIGYVKNVEDLSGISINRDVFDMKKGCRTKSFVVEYGERGYRISTLLKLTDEGELGFVRLDAFVESERDKRHIYDIFDKLSFVLPRLVVGIPVKRYPENLPVIENLENFLRAHLLDSKYVEYVVRTALF